MQDLCQNLAKNMEICTTMCRFFLGKACAASGYVWDSEFPVHFYEGFYCFRTFHHFDKKCTRFFLPFLTHFKFCAISGAVGNCLLDFYVCPCQYCALY